MTSPSHRIADELVAALERGPPAEAGLEAGRILAREPQAVITEALGLIAADPDRRSRLLGTLGLPETADVSDVARLVSRIRAAAQEAGDLAEDAGVDGVAGVVKAAVAAIERLGAELAELALSSESVSAASARLQGALAAWAPRLAPVDIPGDDGRARLARAALATAHLPSLDAEGRQLWRDALAALVAEEDLHLAQADGRILQLQAVAEEDWSEVVAISEALASLAEAGGRRDQTLLHTLEIALARARSGAEPAAALRAAEALATTPDARARVVFARGECAWLAGQRAEAVRAWKQVLEDHRRAPTPLAAGRAAWALARVARAAGHADGERQALQLALRNGQRAADVAVVEQVALALGRRLRESGDADAAEHVLAHLSDDPRYDRVRRALRAGALEEL